MGNMQFTPYALFTFGQAARLRLTSLSAGKNVNFGTVAKMYINSVTRSYVLRNTNAGDLGGHLSRLEGGD